MCTQSEIKSQTQAKFLMLVSYEIGQCSIAFCDRIYLVETQFHLLGHPVYNSSCLYIKQNIPPKDILMLPQALVMVPWAPFMPSYIWNLSVMLVLWLSTNGLGFISISSSFVSNKYINLSIIIQSIALQLQFPYYLVKHIHPSRIY